MEICCEKLESAGGLNCSLKERVAERMWQELQQLARRADPMSKSRKCFCNDEMQILLSKPENAPQVGVVLLVETSAFRQSLLVLEAKFFPVVLENLVVSMFFES